MHGVPDDGTQAQPTDGDVFVPPQPMRLVRSPAQNVSYAWQFFAKRLPLTFMHRTLAGVEHKTLPWVDVRRFARMLGIRSSTQWVRDAVPLDDFDLHTVRLSKGAGWDSVNVLPHAYRVVFADGPLCTQFRPCPRHCCRMHLRTHAHAQDCPKRPHPRLRRYRRADPAHDPRWSEGTRHRFPWLGRLPHYNPIDDADADGGLNGDPRNDARQLIVAAAAAGVKVTIVNVGLRDIKKDVKTCNWESYQEELEEFCAMDLEDMGTDLELVYAEGQVC